VKPALRFGDAEHQPTRAASGTLSESESAAFDELSAANALITVLQPGARQLIHRQTPAASMAVSKPVEQLVRS
jgi:hypothetical protein